MLPWSWLREINNDCCKCEDDDEADDISWRQKHSTKLQSTNHNLQKSYLWWLILWWCLTAVQVLNFERWRLNWTSWNAFAVTCAQLLCASCKASPSLTLLRSCFCSLKIKSKHSSINVACPTLASPISSSCCSVGVVSWRRERSEAARLADALATPCRACAASATNWRLVARQVEARPRAVREEPWLRHRRWRQTRPVEPASPWFAWSSSRSELRLRAWARCDQLKWKFLIRKHQHH